MNLKRLNEFIETENFELEDGKIVKQMLSHGCFVVSIDLKDAYHLVSVKESRKNKKGEKQMKFFWKMRCCIISGVCSVDRYIKVILCNLKLWFGAH